jgi:hypothetical protein
LRKVFPHLIKSAKVQRKLKPYVYWRNVGDLQKMGWIWERIGQQCAGRQERKLSMLRQAKGGVILTASASRRKF